MKRKEIQTHLLWGLVVLILAAALSFTLANGPELAKSAHDSVESSVPKPAGGLPGFEDGLAGQLAELSHEPRPYEGTASFPERLAQAIGMSAFELPSATERPVVVGEVSEVEKGELSRVEIRFERPAIHTEAWLWHHPQGADRLVVLLHGHNTTARGALGLTGDDYMRGIGRDFFEWGADVLAFELSNDGVVSGYMNARLSLFGGQLYGLWVTAVCGGTHAIKAHGKYQEVVLYGMSNGGFIADVASVLCSEFDRIIVDDILTDLPAHAAANTNQLFQHQQYGIYFLTPFLSTLDYLDFLRHSQADKVYTRTKAYWEEHLREAMLAGFREGALSEKAALQIVYKQEMEHSPEPGLLEAIVKGDISGLQGVSLQPKDGEVSR
jgi:hypothetical protein